MSKFLIFHQGTNGLELSVETGTEMRLKISNQGDIKAKAKVDVSIILESAYDLKLLAMHCEDIYKQLKTAIKCKDCGLIVQNTILVCPECMADLRKD